LKNVVTAHLSQQVTLQVSCHRISPDADFDPIRSATTRPVQNG
jgi:hypothetical protein